MPSEEKGIRVEGTDMKKNAGRQCVGDPGNGLVWWDKQSVWSMNKHNKLADIF